MEGLNVWNVKSQWLHEDQGSIYRHLVYPLVVDVANVQLIDWIRSKLKDKFMYWKSQL